MNGTDSINNINDTDIAVIGMACRFPGAADINAFWKNLKEGVSSISFFSAEEAKAAGVDETILEKPGYVKAGAILTGIEYFSADFFDIRPKEAELIDPQHRVFLECAWEALESAGYAGKTEENVIGVYAGGAMNTYLLNNIYPNRDLIEIDSYSMVIGNEKDYLPTRVSYKLNLKGPSVNIQTACSTALTAVHLACQSLLDGECNIALAGGAAIHVPQKAGYWYSEGLIQSPDGHSRTFDARARGTVFGDGVGVVVLKRLEDAASDNDCIHALIKGSASNNDGSLKIGYTTPAVEGQTRVILEAQAIARVAAETITYIEAHGTATALGDPIESEALTRAFRTTTGKKRFCAIGSLKTNIGHPDTASGIAGLIKTILALKHKLLPPNLHFEQPNPKIDFDNSPFYVNTCLSPWKTNGFPCRAGVSSFGIGGSNVHVILEEAWQRQPSGKSRPWHLLVLSAKTSGALEKATANLAAYFEQHPGINLQDAAYTLGERRKGFKHRRALVCQNVDEAAAALRTLDPTSVLTGCQESETHPLVFMFSGQGTQYPGMGLEIYQSEQFFREQVDLCAKYLEPVLGLDLRCILYPGKGQEAEAVQKLNQTAFAQPALFVIEYALAKLWMSWGLYPKAMIGHSIGEYVAACLANVFSLEDALSLVVSRGRLMQQLPGGAMLAVSLPEEKINSFLGSQLSLAAVNAPDSCVVSGPTRAIDLFEKQMNEQGVQCRRLHTSHAFHSRMMEPILGPFQSLVKKIKWNPPQIPYLSNFTGTWITPGNLTDPGYWAKHLRHTVRFAEGLQHLLKDPMQILLEVGPGRTLSTFARKQLGKGSEQLVLTSMRHPRDQKSDLLYLLNTLGRIWLAGGQVDWQGFYANEQCHCLDLPTYPFERQRCWIDPPKKDKPAPRTSQKISGKKPNIDDWFYLPFWKETILPVSPAKVNPESCLVFEDECGVGSLLAVKLKHQCRELITVNPGESFARTGENQYTLPPRQDDDYDALIKELSTRGMPKMIVHLWSVTKGMAGDIDIDRTQELGFYSLFFLAQALGKQGVKDEIHITAVSNNMHAIAGEEESHPGKATILGPVKVIGKEFPNIHCQSIDIVIPPPGEGRTERLIDQLAAEIITPSPEPVIALRGMHRWVQQFEPTRLHNPGTPKLRERGVYLITGGLGGIGLTLAEHLAKTVRARLILTGRSAFPAKEEWNDWLAVQGEDDAVSLKIKKVQALEEHGAEVLVYSADVTHFQQMQDVITRAGKQFGGINGVIHAAGIPDGALILRHTREMLDAVISPKLKGTPVLDCLLKNQALDFFILCSSLRSITGTGGQLGYCAANAFLDTFAHFKRARGIPFTAINWDGWQEVGMIAGNLRKNQSFPENPVFISKETRDVSHPLLDKCIIENTGNMRFISRLNVNRHWFLQEHRIAGKAVLPGTAYLEIARAALESYTQPGMINIRELYFLHPLIVEGNEDKEIHTLLKKQGNGFEFVVKSPAAADTWLEHARGLISSIKSEPAEKYDIEAIKGRCTKDEVTIEPGFAGKSPDQLNGIEIFMKNYGPHWHSLKQVKIGEKEGFALLELPGNLPNDLTDYHLHPALLDIGTAFLSLLDPAHGGYPFSYKGVTIKAPLTKKCCSFVRYADTWGTQAGVFPFNIILMDEQGTELVEIEEYSLRRIETDSPAYKLFQADQEVALTGDTIRGSMKPVGLAVNKEKEEVILSREGIEVFNRIVGCTLPQVIVSTRDLEYHFQFSEAFMKGIVPDGKQDNVSGRLHPRPGLANAYTPPRNELEQKMAQMWQTFLGIKEVGIHDDFFELGGDSLLAFQLVSKIRESLQIDIATHSILSTPTIAELLKETT